MRKKLTIVCLALSGYVWASPVVLPEQLQIGWLQGPDALSMATYCVPDINQQKLDELRQNALRSMIVMSHDGGATPYLIAYGDRLACIDRNGPSKPLLPPSMFAKIISLEGASAQTMETLFRGLAQQLAIRGSADALAKLPNGNAYEFVINVVDPAPVEIMYTMNFLKAGEYDENKYYVVVTDQISSVKISSYASSGRRVLNILQDELSPRPLFGEHLLIQGSDETARYVFAETAWNFRDTGSSIRFLESGIVTFKGKQGNESSGRWLLNEGALYFNYGRVYGSATVQNDKLLVLFRGLPSGVYKKERRWEATLEKGGF